MIDAEEKNEYFLSEIRKKIIEAFDIFDHEGNKMVDIRELGTIIRSLNCCPSEAEISELVAEMEDEDNPGYVQFDRFLSIMTTILSERKFKPASEETLLKAFQILDHQSKGFFTPDELTMLMTSGGEPFTQDEVEEMMSAAVDPETDTINYKEYLATMVVEDDH